MASPYLTLINDFTGKFGLPLMGSVVGNTEATARNLLAVTHEITEAMQQFRWEKQTFRAAWTSVAGEDQGAADTLFPGLKSIINQTFWDNTTQRPVFGPMAESQWQLLKGYPATGPVYQYIVMGGHVLVSPPMVVGDSLSCMYVSRYGVIDASSSPKERVTADTDTFAYPDSVFKSQLEWRWLKQKGEPWLASRDVAEDLIAKNINNNNSLPTLSLDAQAKGITPGIWVPAGSWNV